MPTERRLRTICAAPSSKLTYSVRSPRRHAATANSPARVDLAVPGDSAKHKILIEFFALRGPSGKYLGCMEHTQDVESIRHLQGEKRLLG